jgi:hypothetical protein
MSSKECRHPTCGETCRRTKKVKKIYTLKRTPIRKRSKKKQQSLGEQVLTQQKDWLFFLEIWNERDHICYETGDPIYGEPLTLYFHHVLEKELYEEYRYCKWNIVLVTWETHSKCHNNIDFAPKVKAYRDKLIKKLKL